MIILGIEAAAKVAGVAVLKDGVILSQESSNAGLTHSQTLLPMIDETLSKAGLSVEEVDYIALTNGPGSFTGLRIGAATAKGLAMGCGARVIAVDTLESLAYEASCGFWSGNAEAAETEEAEEAEKANKAEKAQRAERAEKADEADVAERAAEAAEAFEGGADKLIVPTMDARRGQVYCAVYQGGKAVIPEDTVEPQLLLDELLKREEPCLFTGDAADLYETFFSGGLQERYHKAPPHLKQLSAAATCALAYEKVMKDPSCAIDGGDLRINYLRKPQAVREREERLRREEEARLQEIKQEETSGGTADG